MQSIKKILKQHKEKNSTLITVLHDIHKEIGYFSEEIAKAISKELKFPLSQIYGVITFYPRFSLKDRGENVVHVCCGTGCYVNKSKKILNEVEKTLGIKLGETTKDKKFTIERVNCLGTCAISPAIVINEKTYGNLTPKKVREIFRKWRNE